MKPNRTIPSWSLLALSAAVVAGAVLLAPRAEALRPAFLAAPPTPVGVVNMASLFDRLDEAAEWDVKIKNLEAKFSEELQSRRAELEKLAKEIEPLPEGEDREKRLDGLRLKRLQAEQWSVMKDLELDRERSLKWQSIYRAVREGAAKLASEEKYELVLVDDSKLEIQPQRSKDSPPLEVQVRSQIAQIRVLHAAKTVDVTEKMIVLINNARASAPKTQR